MSETSDGAEPTPDPFDFPLRCTGIAKDRGRRCMGIGMLGLDYSREDPVCYGHANKEQQERNRRDSQPGVPCYEVNRRVKRGSEHERRRAWRAYWREEKYADENRIVNGIDPDRSVTISNSALARFVSRATKDAVMVAMFAIARMDDSRVAVFDPGEVVGVRTMTEQRLERAVGDAVYHGALESDSDMTRMTVSRALARTDSLH